MKQKVLIDKHELPEHERTAILGDLWFSVEGGLAEL